ncbi:MAG: TetR/AcrR family transcriptional regulator [Lachnotalea sp.]
MTEKINMKDKIIDAAWVLFHEKGYENTTVDDIIVAANTSKGSFYYYFDRKDALLDTLANRFDNEYSKLEARIKPELNCYDKLLFINYEMHLFIEKQIDVDLISSLYSTQLLIKGNSNLIDQNRFYYKLVSDIIEEGQSKAHITKTESVRELTQYYTLCERALVSDWCLNRGGYSLAEKSKKFMPMMIQALKEIEIQPDSK